MPKKNMSPEERKAFGEKMKAARAAKMVFVGTQDVPTPVTSFSDEDYLELLKRVKELEKGAYATPQLDTVSVNQRGQLVGTYEKYGVDPAYYPTPIERLVKEPRLQRFAFPLNYELVFDVGISSYQTQDGVNTKEPKFTLQLIVIMMDEETGEPTNQRYMRNQMIFHEDPQAALIIARDNGVEVDESNEKAFLDEMRYLRMRDWLLGIFYPAKATNIRRKQEAVIGNRVVEVYEINSPDSQTVPFDQLSKKF